MAATPVSSRETDVALRRLAVEAACVEETSDFSPSDNSAKFSLRWRTKKSSATWRKALY